MNMKKIIAVLSLALACTVMAEGPTFAPLNVPVSMKDTAAGTTNATAGNPFFFYAGQSPVRIWASFTGTPATTNGSFTVKFSTASGLHSPPGASITNEFDTAASSAIKLVATTMNGATVGAGTTNTISDWFQVGGAGWIRLGQVENTFLGPVSNLTITIGYTQGQGR